MGIVGQSLTHEGDVKKHKEILILNLQWSVYQTFPRRISENAIGVKCVRPAVLSGILGIAYVTPGSTTFMAGMLFECISRTTDT